ncbi:MAG: hypothetical protein RM021_028000 [Nostoc sp. EkiNYC01]
MLANASAPRREAGRSPTKKYLCKRSITLSTTENLLIFAKTPATPPIKSGSRSISFPSMACSLGAQR